MDHAADPAVECSAIAKISWRLLPLIGLSYLIANIDRANVSFAALQMNTDLGFGAAVYGLGAGLFFAGYSIFEIPSNMLLVRFGARRWIARIMMTWGLISAGMMFVRTPTQFYVMRFLLGVAEAGFYPGVVFYLSHWFPSAWCGRAITRFYIAGALASTVMGGLAGAIFGLDGRLGLAGWQWLFLVEGLPAVVIALAMLRFLPDSPATAAWLSTAEKDWLARRLVADVTASGAAHHNFVRTLSDPIVLGVGLVLGLTFMAFNAVLFSGPKILVDATGWSIGAVGFVIAAGGVLTAAAMLLAGWHSDLRRERHLHLVAMIAIAAIAAAGMALAPSMPQPLTRTVTVGCFILFISSGFITGPLATPMASETLHPGSRAVGLAAINTLAQVGNFLGPVLWGLAAHRTGDFRLGLGVIPFVLLTATGIVLAMRQSAMRPSAAALSAT
jgi:MFS transporter, ACS family, tartrate transporter